MQELVKLTEKEFLTGLSATQHLSTGGLFKNMSGLTTTRDYRLLNSDLGILQAHNTLTQVLNINNKALSYTTDENNAYISTTDGIYKISNTNIAVATQLFSNINLTGDMEIFSPKDTNIKNLLYAQNNAIGLYGDLNGAPTNNDTWFTTGIENTSIRPMHKLWDEVYFGNKNKIGRIKDDLNGGMLQESNVLDFENTMHVTAISDDGEYLVVGLVDNTDIHQKGKTIIRFWQINQPSWTYEYELPEAYIYDIKRVGNVVYILSPNGLYYTARGTAPRMIIPLNLNTESNIQRIGDAVIFPYGKNVTSFGKIFHEIPTAWHSLAYSVNEINKVFSGINNNYFYISTSVGLFLNNLDTTTRQIGTADTLYMQLGVSAHITAIEVILAEPMQIADEFSIHISRYHNEPYKLYKTAKGSVYKSRKIFLSKSGINDVTQLSLRFEIKGNVKIRQVIVYGDIQS